MKTLSLFLPIVFATSFQLCLAQPKPELLKIDWPDEYHWKVGSNQENDQEQMIELVPGNETVDNWTIIGTMISIKGMKNIPMDVAMNMMFDQAKKEALDPKLTFIEKDEHAKYPWIIFKIESSKFKSDPNPESQLYYVVQGSESLYTNLVAQKEKSLTNSFVEKWTKVFKKSEIVDHE